MAELRPYNPTWRDRLGAYLYDKTSGSPEARNFVGGMVGSTGLGTQGMGLVDAVPVVGQALQAQEAAQRGDAKGVAMAVVPLPARYGRFGGMMSPIDELYHGSPKLGLTELRASDRGPLGPGTYASTAPQIAGHYAGEGGQVYQVPHEGLDIYRGEGHRTDDQWFGYKNDKARLMAVLPEDKRAVLEPMIEKMWSSDGYPLYQRIRGEMGSDAAAQGLFKAAGFHGISGQIDGPETVIFGNVGLPPVADKVKR